MNQSCRECTPKKQSCQSSIHTFVLQPVDSTCYYQTVTVDFSPVADEKGNQFKVIPTFNRDLNPKTTAFITQFDKKNQQISVLSVHEPSKIMPQSKALQRTQIYQPKPMNNFCYVCREPYYDYIKHIDHKIHKKNLTANQYTRQINELAQYYKQSNIDIRLLRKVSSKSSLEEQVSHLIIPKNKRIYLSPILEYGDCKSTHSHISSGQGNSLGKYSNFSLR